MTNVSSVLVEAIATLGNPFTLLLGSIAVFAFLLVHEVSRLALSWLAAIAACIFITIVTKLLFMGLSMAYPYFAEIGLFSPSGHASFSFTFYVCLAIIFSNDETSTKWIPLLAAILLSGAIGQTRILSDDHSFLEVVLGYGIGSVSVFLFVIFGRRAQALQAPPKSMALLALCIALIMFLLRGQQLSAEEFLVSAAGRMWAALK